MSSLYKSSFIYLSVLTIFSSCFLLADSQNEITCARDMYKSVSVVENQPAGETVATIANITPDYLFIREITSGIQLIVYQNYFEEDQADWTIRTKVQVDRDAMAHSLMNPMEPVVFNIIFRIIDRNYQMVNNVTCIYLTLNVIDIDDNVPHSTPTTDAPGPTGEYSTSTTVDSQNGITCARNMYKSVSVVENQPAGETVATIANITPGYLFIREITSGIQLIVYQNYFEEDQADWTIRIKAQVDRDAMAHSLMNPTEPVVFNIIFRIIDRNYQMVNNVTCIYLTLNVIDIDDNVPHSTPTTDAPGPTGEYSTSTTVDSQNEITCARDMYKSVSVVENQPAGETVATIANITPGYLFIREITSGIQLIVYQNYFEEDQADWTIRTKAQVDRDAMAHSLMNPTEPVVFNIIFRIIDRNYQMVNNITCIHLTLNVIDIDDNVPRFPAAQLPYIIRINEGTLNAREPLPKAEDADEGVNSTTNYTLVGGLGIFRLELRRDQRGAISEVLIRNNFCLDAREQASYNLTVIASEGNENPDSDQLPVEVIVVPNPRCGLYHLNASNKSAITHTARQATTPRTDASTGRPDSTPRTKDGTINTTEEPTGKHSTPRTDASVGLAVAVITFVVTAATSVIIGLLIGSAVTYCFLKKQRGIGMADGTISNGKVERPLNLYQEVTTDKKPTAQLTSSSQQGVI